MTPPRRWWWGVCRRVAVLRARAPPPQDRQTVRGALGDACHHRRACRRRAGVGHTYASKAKIRSGRHRLETSKKKGGKKNTAASLCATRRRRFTCVLSPPRAPLAIKTPLFQHEKSLRRGVRVYHRDVVSRALVPATQLGAGEDDDECSHPGPLRSSLSPTERDDLVSLRLRALGTGLHRKGKKKICRDPTRHTCVFLRHPFNSRITVHKMRPVFLHEDRGRFHRFSSHRASLGYLYQVLVSILVPLSYRTNPRKTRVSQDFFVVPSDFSWI